MKKRDGFVGEKTPWGGDNLLHDRPFLHSRPMADAGPKPPALSGRMVDWLPAVVVKIGMDGMAEYVSAACRSLLGYDPSELVGGPFFDTIACRKNDDLSFTGVTTKYGDGDYAVEMLAARKGGAVIWIEAVLRRIEEGSETQGQGFVAVIHDITRRKEIEAAREERLMAAEEKIRAETRRVKEADSVVRALLNRMERDKAELQKRVAANIRELLLPSLNRIRRQPGAGSFVPYLDAMEDNLKSVAASLPREMVARCYGLTPTEIEVAHHVKNGRTTREIANILNISEKTVGNHRMNIRRKVGLTKKRENLKKFLTDLS